MSFQESHFENVNSMLNMRSRIYFWCSDSNRRCPIYLHKYTDMKAWVKITPIFV